MNDIETKALAMINAEIDRDSTCTGSPEYEALCRAIEQHEAFRQEVSDAVESLCNTVLMSHLHRQLREMLSQRFIIAKPDPLVEAVKDCQFASLDAIEDYVAKKLRAAIEKRGGKIVWEND